MSPPLVFPPQVSPPQVSRPLVSPPKVSPPQVSNRIRLAVHSPLHPHQTAGNTTNQTMPLIPSHVEVVHKKDEKARGSVDVLIYYWDDKDCTG